VDLSHQSITGRQFDVNRRGYEPEAVDAHLAEIAAAVTARNNRLAELEATVDTLQAKVQDADESEEALRLTLKAAAHAKEELLANAREQAKTMEDEAAAKAASMVAEAEAQASQLTTRSEARAKAVEEGAKAQAGEVAKAALAESEALVNRIEDLRVKLKVAEDALGALHVETSPQVETTRHALDAAIAQARETAANPQLLAAAAPDPEVVAPDAEIGHDDLFEEPMEQPDPQEQPPAEVDAAPEAEIPAAEASPPSFDQVPAEVAVPVPVAQESTQPVAADDARFDHQDQPVVDAEEVHHTDAGHAEVAAPPVPEVPVEPETPADGPHLEVVEAEEPLAERGESAADISDKVDRLLEELREVT
jgi:DivIVA domain-containing protein